MNQELVNFINLCLNDGVISDKEREVILRKSRALGVPDDECEILIDGLTSQNKSKANISNVVLDNESTKNIDLDENSITKILNLDSNVLIQIMDYLRLVDVAFQKAIASEHLNEKFHHWYKSLTSILVKHNENFGGSYYVYFYEINDFQLRWDDFRFLDDLEKEEISQQLNLSISSIIGVVKNSDNGLSLFVNDGIIEVSLSYKKNFFSSEKRCWNIIKHTKINDVNILDFDNPLIIKLTSLLRGFLAKTDYYDDFYKTVSNFNISYDPSNSLSLIPGKKFFGDDLVVKLSHFIKTLISNLSSFISEKKVFDKPISYYKNNRSGYNVHCFNVINEIINNLKSISNLIQIRNELLLYVLTNDRGKILLITEQLDGLGVLMNHYQKNHLDKMDKTIDVLTKGFEQLSGAISGLSSSLESLNRNLYDGMNNINESLKINNLLTTIQTYQIYKINKNTNGLLK